MTWVLKRQIKIVLSVIVSVFTGMSLLIYTGGLVTYRHRSSGNEPSIERNSTIVVSNVFQYSKGDLLCYQYSNSQNEKECAVKRLIAVEDDVVEIIAGVTFVNGKNVDRDLKLKHSYLLSGKDISKVGNDQLMRSFYTGVKINGVFKMELTDEFALQQNFFSKINLSEKGFSDPTISEVYGENWNVDYFGPLTIPKGKCFLLGDNRHNSADSRFTGLVDLSSIVGIVIFHLQRPEDNT